MTKPTKAESNRNNALKSTGPKSPAGKAISAQNRLSHGVLSSHLILPNESRDEFDALLAELQQEFMPQGLLEMALVERIAIALWRQRRLVRAESAEIELRQSTSRAYALQEISHALGLGNRDTKAEKEWDGLSGFNEKRTPEELLVYLNNCLSALNAKVDIDILTHDYPIIYQALKEDALRADHSNLIEYLEDEFNGLGGYLKFYYDCYFLHWQKAVVRQLVQTYKKSVSLPRVPENMARYQSSLDNELYKAIRALRDAQAWRAERRLNIATTVSDSKSD